MKKMILFLFVSSILSCSKDKELADLSNGNNNNNNNAVTSNNETSVDPTENELRKYFNIESTQDIDLAVNNITTIKDAKTIGTKEIVVQEAIIETKNIELGTISTKVSGKIGTKEFSKKYTFFNFVQKPYDSYMASRAYMRWKPEFEKDPEILTSIDFDALFRLKKTDLFTIEYLSKWIDIYSSSPNPNVFYKFTSEDLKNTKIVDVQYRNDGLYFKIKYKNQEGKSMSLSFDKDEYYKTKVVLDKDEIKKYFAEGVYQNFNDFYGILTKLSSGNEFNLKLSDNSNPRLDRSSNTISCHLTLSTKKDDELAVFEYQFTGFKSLSDLSNDLVAQTTFELSSYMERYLQNVPDGDVTEKLSKTLRIWVKKVEFGIIRKDNIINTLGGNQIIRLPQGQLALKLEVSKATQNGVSVEALSTISRRAMHQDILLVNPYFGIKSAIKKQGKLIFELELQYVNEESLKDVKRKIEVQL
ncbi:hypothetical protein [Flavobacterium oreochromis]|nr:hypothetical protein [Flavobacterium oreochromis]